MVDSSSQTETVQDVVIDGTPSVHPPPSDTAERSQKLVVDSSQLSSKIVGDAVQAETVDTRDSIR